MKISTNKNNDSYFKSCVNLLIIVLLYMITGTCMYADKSV